MVSLNPHISVDCVIFGFDTQELKILLVDRNMLPGETSTISSGQMKLPGNLIDQNEDLDQSAYRVLKELTGLENIYLKQFAVFGSPARLNNQNDMLWLQSTSGLTIERVVTIAYYSLVKIDESNPQSHLSQNAKWVLVKNLPNLIFDHREIILKALETLRKELRTEPVGFELLPKKFTLRQLQNLYEVILGTELDNRNFRKKISKLEYLIPLNEKEVGVNHKPAQFYKFDKKIYKKTQKDLGFVI
jgi:8-oxo-dGTP diphosphatase